MKFDIAQAPNATVVGVTHPGGGAAEVVSFDLEGRPRTHFHESNLYKRAWDSRVVGRRTIAGARRRWQATRAEADALFVRSAQVAAWASADAAQRGVNPELQARLERAAAWTPERLRGEAARFAAAYTSISILPPDQYDAVVLQATLGCSWNRCTFCNFYQDRPFTVRDETAFDAHLRAVAALMGRDAATRRWLFLADGNALALAPSRSTPLLLRARAVFGARAIAGFVDVFSGVKRSVADWRALAALGLQRVAIGVETGHDPLLATLGKPGGAEATRAFVTTLKEAGLEVALIFMVGAGGTRYADLHERDTLTLLASLPIGAEDLIYLSPFVTHPDGAYARLAEREGIEALSDAAIATRMAALRAGIARVRPGPRVARYLIEEFVY